MLYLNRHEEDHTTKEIFVKRIYMISAFMMTVTTFSLVSGLHKIRISGDSIVKEGTEGTYVLSVTNTSKTDYEDLNITIDGFSSSGLDYCSSSSDDLRIFENILVESGSLEAYCEYVRVGETVKMAFSAQGTRLKIPGDVHSITLTINVNPGNVRKGTIRKQISIFKAD